MFGNAPRVLWERWYEPDERNRIGFACRCLLVEEDDRRILFESGIGAFFDPRLKDRYGVVEDEHVLLSSLESLGLAPKDIDVIVLSHLHFDHAGGLLTPWQKDAVPELAFPDAHYVIGAEAWRRAENPHPRDRASFIPELIPLLQGAAVELVDGPTSKTLGDSYRFHFSEGHTPGLLLTEIDMPAGPIVFAADLIPGTSWVHLPITMGYDRYPEKLIDEKRVLLDDLVARNGRLFYTHDPNTAMSHVAVQNNRYRASDEVASLNRLER